MRGPRTAAIAFGMVDELCRRLEAAGVTAENAPLLDEAFAAMWPAAREMAKLEETVDSAADASRQARAATIDAAFAQFTSHLPKPAGTPDAPVLAGLTATEPFRPEQWTVALIAAPAPDRDREVA